MMKPKVLVDLALAHRSLGFSGIPQDSRLLFDGLVASDRILPTGLLWSSAESWHGRPPTTLEEQAIFLGVHLSSPRSHRSSRAIGKISGQLGKIVERIILGRHASSSIETVSNPQLKGMIYRQLFSSTIDPSHRKALEQSEFAISCFGIWAPNDSAVFNMSSPRLNTRGYEFVVFQDARSLRVSPGTRKVVRYHDGLPVLASDTMKNAYVTKLHLRAVKRCAEDSLFVCNSPSAVSDLAQISEKAAENAIVIPYFVPRMKNVDLGSAKLWELAATRISPSTAGKLEPDAIARRWFTSEGTAGKPEGGRPTEGGGGSGGLGTPSFIMGLATIEPRKNYQGLIRSWQKLRAATGRDVRLLIVGKPGWEFEPILSEMRPYVAAGTLLHLEGLPQNELQVWYKAAACFAFPSFAEGFGLPPVEAMQCGCPVMVSDIPAHRYASGDAALYCDPYDEDDMAAKLNMLTDPDRRNEYAAMVERGYRNADRFTVAKVLPLWEDFFALHRQGKGGVAA